MPRPPAARSAWIAWALVLVGGLLVLAATGVALTSPCADSRATVPGACEASSVTAIVTVLVASGTVMAVTGGIAAAVVLARRLLGGAGEPDPWHRRA